MVAWFLAAFVVLVLDQVTKELSQHRASTRAPARSASSATLARVTRARVGLGRVRDRRLLVALWLVAAVGSIVALQVVEAFEGRAALIGLGAALGGATGNALDMWRRGAAVDFIDLRVWPAFNLADVAIVGGVVAALWSAA